MTYILVNWNLSDADQTQIEVDVEADRDNNCEVTGIRVIDDGKWRDVSDLHFVAIHDKLINNHDFWDRVFEDLPCARESEREHYRDLMREYA